jgi:hypothetical protein
MRRFWPQMKHVFLAEEDETEAGRPDGVKCLDIAREILAGKLLVVLEFVAMWFDNYQAARVSHKTGVPSKNRAINDHGYFYLRHQSDCIVALLSVEFISRENEGALEADAAASSCHGSRDRHHRLDCYYCGCCGNYY